MSRYNDRIELAALAHRRYPDMELPLAVMCFQSDRRRAGLGALDEHRRRGLRLSGIRNYKCDVIEHRQARYHMIRHTPARMEYERQAGEDFNPNASYAEMTVQMIQIPERSEHLCVAADYADLVEQYGRHRIAAALREARRQIRGSGRTSPNRTQ
jgi:hypothetical protein